MTTKKIGVLTRVEVREIWPEEAADFAPWLADNLDSLGAGLGFDLEILGREAPVGCFAVDALASDVSRDKVVMIGNQLELFQQRVAPTVESHT